MIRTVPRKGVRFVGDVRGGATPVRTLREIWKFDRLDFGSAIITMLGVVAVGAINDILIAVGLALVRFVSADRAPAR